MRTLRLKDQTPDQYAALLRRSEADFSRLVPRVRAIMEDVRRHGDRALLKYTRRFDGVALTSPRVTEAEFAEARAQVAPDLTRALDAAIAQVTRFHRRQVPPEARVRTQPGVTVWRVWRPIERVGLYVPGGTAIYPSSVIMNGVPARIAGCPQVVLCVPPGPDGRLPAPVLAAAERLGIRQVFKAGGAQAIAAMAYGTESVPRAYKLFGAGNAYVTVAKMLAFGAVDIDMPAGPSEIVVLCDGGADPTFVAADLLSQAEHGADSQCILVTTSAALARRVGREVERQLAALPNQARLRQALDRHGLVLLARDLAEGLRFVNDYAPEHLEIVAAGAARLLPAVRNAGSVFLGPYAPVPGGDYATGSNHVLPTGGYARMFPPLSVESFGRKMQVQSLTRAGLGRIRGAVERLAEAEGLPAHQHAVAVRFRPAKKVRSVGKCGVRSAECGVRGPELATTNPGPALRTPHSALRTSLRGDRHAQ